MGEIITKTNKEVLQFFDEMKRISTFIDALKSGYTPSLNGLSDRHRIVRNAQTD